MNFGTSIVSLCVWGWCKWLTQKKPSPFWCHSNIVIELLLRVWLCGPFGWKGATLTFKNIRHDVKRRQQKNPQGLLEYARIALDIACKDAYKAASTMMHSEVMTKVEERPEFLTIGIALEPCIGTQECLMWPWLILGWLLVFVCFSYVGSTQENLPRSLF
jgi:hypothetical protein